MIKRLDQILVVSDVDNTLLNAAAGITPGCNTAVIRLFCRLGGKFTVATGRNVESVRHLTEGKDAIELSAPAITCGGAVIYDLAADRPVAQSFVDRHSARQALRDVLGRFPKLGVEIMTDNGRIYVVNPNQQVCTHAENERLSYVVSRLEDVPGEWNKVLFADSPEKLEPVQQFVKDRRYENITFLRTSAPYFEIMPQNVDKGSALRLLAGHLGIPMENVWAIGDYYNDIDLLRAAGHRVAVGNAVPEVKALCEEEVLPCLDGGVAQLLYRLIKEYS